MLTIHYGDGSFHEVDSSLFAFKVVVAMTLREVKNNSKNTNLEPIMKVEVVIPAMGMSLLI